jgi:superfamily II DNA or RNA helicase
MGDIFTFKDVAGGMGIQVSVERSKSGNGGHAWIFFSEPVSARNARQLGTIILSRTMQVRPNMRLESYDRFFPNQDFLPKGGFGNLIALPLQKKAREQGNSVFVDVNGEVIKDQWAYLSTRRRMNNEDLIRIIRKFGTTLEKETAIEEEIKAAEDNLKSSSVDLSGKLAGKRLQIELGAMLRIAIDALPMQITSALKRTSVFANPKFYELQKLRFSTWKTPRYISCGEIDGNDLLLPRGCLQKVVDIINQASGDLSFIDKRIENSSIKLKFNGELTEQQTLAVAEMKKHEIGVLVAPPGGGKTVMACELIAHHGQRTLILTHRKQLVDQWKSQLEHFIEYDEKVKPVEVKMIQTIARQGITKTIGLDKYGFVIVDECHHIPALSFESILKGITAKYILGLTATPYRKDGLQPIITMQCGDIRYEMKDTEITTGNRVVIFKQTDFRPLNEGMTQEPIHIVWKRMINDDKRNKLIAADVIEVLTQKRFPLILSDRKEHIDLLFELITQCTAEMQLRGFCLVGDLGKKERKRILEDIKKCMTSDIPIFLIATGSFLGEGFDLPELDTLFLTMPIAFKGRIIQYTGRIHRASPNKNNIIVYDYFDIHHPLTISMFRKRIRAYRKMGYSIDKNGLTDPQRLIGEKGYRKKFHGSVPITKAESSVKTRNRPNSGQGLDFSDTSPHRDE